MSATPFPDLYVIFLCVLSNLTLIKQFIFFHEMNILTVTDTYYGS